MYDFNTLALKEWPGIQLNQIKLKKDLTFISKEAFFVSEDKI